MKNNNVQSRSRLTMSFEWHSLVRDFRRNFWLILMAGVIGFMGLYIYERSVYVPKYVSSATLAIRANAGTTDSYRSISVSASMTKAFTYVFEEPTMQQLAAENLGMESFEGTVDAEEVKSLNILNLSVAADDPELAYHQLCSILEIYPDISDTVFSDAVIDVLVYPEMPATPSNRVSVLLRGIASLAAMVVMGGLIGLLSLLRDTVKTEKIFTEAVDADLIGTVCHEKPHLTGQERLSKRKRAMLINDAYASLRFSEDYQKIATKLEHIHKQEGSKTFAVTSVAENEGKSTVAANVAIALANRGYHVLLIDLDVKKPSVYKIFGYRASGAVDFTEVLSGKLELKDYRIPRYKKTNLYVAMSRRHHKNSGQWIGSDTVKQTIDEMARNMDFVFIDTSPVSASADAASLIAMCDKTLLVVRTDRVEVADINDTVVTIANLGGNLAGCILNDVYKPFTMFGQMGVDESGYYHYRYGSYGRYGGYGNQAFTGFSFDQTEQTE